MPDAVRKLFLIGLLSVLYLLILNSPVCLLESTESPKEPSLAAYIRYGHMETWQEENRVITALTGKVELYQAHQTILAESLIGWGEMKSRATEGKEPSDIFDEIYAEGNVKIIRGKDQIWTDRVYYNFKTGQGIMLNVKIRTAYTDETGNIPSGAVPLVIRAKEIYQINQTTLLAKHASVTTCPHGKPHYHFWVETVKFIWDEKGKRVTLTHIIPHIAGIPFFYWPYLSKTIGEDPFIRAIKIEKSKRFGVTSMIRYGININKYIREPSGEIKKDKLGYYRTTRWGDCTIQNTHYQKRGLAWEPELNYQWHRYEGFIKGYYLKDKGPDPDLEYEQQFLPLEHKDRGRGEIFHRQWLSENLRVETEMNWVSDRNFRQEFLETEYKEGKEPESYGYLRYISQNKGVTILERLRPNEFQTQTEYLPRLSGMIISEPIFSRQGYPRLYFSSFTEGSNIRIRYDDELDQGSLRSWRIDSLNEIMTRLAIKPLNLAPFFAARYTGYEQGTVEDNYLDRFVASGGLKLSTQFYKKYGNTDQTTPTTELIHYLSLDFRYTNNFQVTTRPTSLMPFDSTDQINKFEEGYFELRNRFVKNGSEFLNVGTAVEYYPESYRDTTAPNPNNYFYPMNWITLAPDKQVQYPRRRFSNIYLDVRCLSLNPLGLYLNTEYNTYQKATEVLNTTVSLNPYPGWSLSLSERYVREMSNALGLNLVCVPIEKWQLGISDQYDFEQHRFTNRVYTIRRDLHELFLEFTIWVDKGKGETLYNITLTPRGLFERPLKIRSY